MGVRHVSHYLAGSPLVICGSRSPVLATEQNTILEDLVVSFAAVPWGNMFCESVTWRHGTTPFSPRAICGVIGYSRLRKQRNFPIFYLGHLDEKYALDFSSRTINNKFKYNSICPCFDLKYVYYIIYHILQNLSNAIAINDIIKEPPFL